MIADDHAGRRPRQPRPSDIRILSCIIAPTTPNNGTTSRAIALGCCLALRPALQCRMPELTRRRSPDHREECWHIYYGDIYADTITERVGNPHDTDRWEWCCGFYPGSEPGEISSDTAATFDEARYSNHAAAAHPKNTDQDPSNIVAFTK